MRTFGDGLSANTKINHSAFTQQPISQSIPPSSRQSIGLQPKLQMPSSSGTETSSSGLSSWMFDANAWDWTNSTAKTNAAPKLSTGSAISQDPTTRKEPSPHHPSISKLPSISILAETRKRLESNDGIRLIAHGVHCHPKTVRIRVDMDTFSLSWQTEFYKPMPTASTTTTTTTTTPILMQGTLHKIALPNILYIDVGKRTSALTKVENSNLLDTWCFSLLTQNGSLDLQASSPTERDALVSCFSILLDQVHNRDWRNMYSDDGTSSVVSSSIAISNPKFPSEDFVEI
jgi:hypothetical protein